MVSVSFHWHHWLRDSSGVRQRQKMYPCIPKERGRAVERNIIWKPMIVMDRKIQKHIPFYKNAVNQGRRRNKRRRQSSLSEEVSIQMSAARSKRCQKARLQGRSSHCDNADRDHFNQNKVKQSIPSSSRKHHKASDTDSGRSSCSSSQWSSSRSSSGSSSSTKASSSRSARCYFCQQKGHFKTDCREYKRWQSCKQGKTDKPARNSPAKSKETSV